MLRSLVAVFFGGLIGTSLRLGLDLALPHTGEQFPLSTFIINVAGSFTLGLLVTTVWVRPGVPPWLRAGLGVGVLGSFTTFSAVAVSLVDLTSRGNTPLAVGYIAATLIAGLGAAALGIASGHRLALGPERGDWSTE